MKNLIKKLLREGLLRESRASEAQALNVLKKFGNENPEESVNTLKGLDGSNNQVNLPAMAIFYASGNADETNLKSVFDEYNELINKKRVKPAQATKKGVVMGDKVFTEFLTFASYIHGETGRYAEKSTGSVVDNFEAEEKPLPFGGDNIDIYDGIDVGKCIKYTSGSLTGREDGYSFCIGQPGNTMYQSYRDTKDSSFYFIIDRNKFKTEENGSVNLDDPLHIIVFDNTSHGVELTDANNRTTGKYENGAISEFGSGEEAVDGYIAYLKSKGVDVDKLINKPQTPEEKKEAELLGKPNRDLDWFINLSYDYKSKYIGRGHSLTDAQFDYLIGA